MSTLHPLLRLAIEFAGEQIAEDIITGGLDEALSLMESMCANEGQSSVFESTIAPEFEANTAQALDSEDYQWEDVDAGDYMDFMGEIVAEGNGIMASACLYAQIVEEASDEISGLDDDGIGEDEADFEL